MRGFLYLVLVLLGIGAITAALRDDDVAESELAGAEAPVADPEVAGGPSLSGRDPAGGAAPTGRALVPAAIYDEANGLRKPGQPARLRPWLEEDGSHLLDLIAEHVRRMEKPEQGRKPRAAKDADSRVIGETVRWIRHQMHMHRELWPDLRASVTHALGETGHPPALMAGLLGALLAQPEHGSRVPTLRALMADGNQHAAVRFLAAEGLHGLGVATVQDEIAQVAIIEATWPVGRRSLHRLLPRLKKRGDDVVAAVPALVRLLQSGSLNISDWSLRKLIFETLQAIGSSHPDFRAALAQLVMDDHRILSRRSRSMLFDGDVDTVLAQMETMPGSARIGGVAVLLQRGVAPERLRSHVLAVLASKNPASRRRALAMLGKVGPDVADVMPILERHFASEDHARWITAVQALGLLATVPGNRDPAIDRLFAVTRSVDPQVRRIAVQSILMHEAKPDKVIEILNGLLRDSEVRVRREAVDGLGELVAKHAEARRALEAARNDSDADVRELVAYWLDDDDDDDDDDD